MTSIQKIVVGVLVALTLLFGYLYFTGANSPFIAGAVNPTGPQHFQMEAFLQGIAFGTRNQTSADNAGCLTIGASGTKVCQVIDTTCNAIVYGSTIAASSSAFADCPVTGILSTDRVDATLALGSSIPPSFNFSLQGAGASTTAGYARFSIFNSTGAATSSYKQATTSVHIQVYR